MKVTMKKFFFLLFLVQHAIFANIHWFVKNSRNTFFLDKNGVIQELKNTENGKIFIPYYDEALQRSKCKFEKLFAGAHHTLALDNDSYLWSIGVNRDGQLGIGHNDNRIRFTFIESLPNIQIKDVAAGGFHNLVLYHDGSVWVFGNNKRGQLGLGDYEDRLEPVPVNFFKRIAAVAAGEHHSAFLDEDGGVWMFGNNLNGELGLGDYENKKTPTPLALNHKIISIHLGGNHTILVDEHQQIWVFGRGIEGQLGLGDEESKSVPTRLEFNQEFETILTGKSHSMILDKQGNLWGFGRNFEGQLGFKKHNNVISPTELDLGVKFTQASCNGFTTITVDDTDAIRIFYRGAPKFMANPHINDTSKPLTDYIPEILSLPFNVANK